MFTGCGAKTLAGADAANAKGWRTKATSRAGRQNTTEAICGRRQVIATLRNPVYLGLFRTGGFRIGHHEAIVTHELFAAVSARLRRAAHERRADVTKSTGG